MVEGRNCRSIGDLAGALREFTIAAQRNPADESSGRLLEEVRLEVARKAAFQAAAGKPATDATDPRLVQIRRHLELSRRYLVDNQSDEALKEHKLASEIDASHPGVLLGEARLAAAKALGILASAEAVEELVVALTDEERSVRQAAEAALTQIDPNWVQSDAAQRASTRLEASLNDRPAWVRSAILQALAKLRAPGPVTPVE